VLLEVAFWASVACAVAGSYYGDRAGTALMCSALFAGAITALGADFALWAWAGIDIVTALAIIRKGMPRRDILIVAMFLPGWAFYLLPDPWRFWGSSVVVIAQMMLVFPVAQVRGRFKAARPPNNLWDDFLPKDIHR